jgi:hypothetical protein
MKFRQEYSYSICTIWGFHGGDYKKCRPLGYRNPVRTSLETHYVSATEPSRLMLCKICGFHGRDYEECRLLGYKNPIHTSQETRYFSATEPSRLKLCKIWGFHGRIYEECRFLDIETQFVPGREYNTSLLHSPAVYCYERIEFLAAVTMKIAVFWDAT